MVSSLALGGLLLGVWDVAGAEMSVCLSEQGWGGAAGGSPTHIFPCNGDRCLSGTPQVSVRCPGLQQL